MDHETNPEPQKSRLTVDMPTRKPRGFKIALLIMAVLLVLFVCTIVFLPHFLPIGTIREIAQTQARDLAGLHVDFANLRFGWNGDLLLDDIVVSPLGPDGTPGDSLLTVDEVRTNVALTPLLSGKAVVNSVNVSGFALNLVRDAEGRLNLPDFEKLGKAAGEEVASRSARAAAGGRMMLSSALAAEEAAPASAPSLPPIELRRINLQDGVVAFTDEARGMNFTLGVRTVAIEGGSSLDEPFNLSGKINPYSENPELGEVDFTGTVAMLRGGALDLDGRASLEAGIANFSLGTLAEKLGLSELLPAGSVNGSVKLGYAERKAGLVVPEMRISEALVGTGGGAALAVPETRLTLDAAFDPAADAISLASASVMNEMFDLTAGGSVAGVSALAAGGLPGADIDFGGTMDFTRVSHYLSTRIPGLETLPELNGSGEFSGRAGLPAAPAGTAPAPTLTLSLENGDLQIIESATGITAGLDLRGIAVAANAELTDPPAVHSRVDLAGVPLRAFLPQLGDEPVAATLTGGVAFEMTAATLAAELRANGSSLALPATPWSTAANIHDAAAHVTADLRNDILTVHSLDAIVNESIRAQVSAGTLRGALAGAPQGSADMQFSAPLRELRQFAQPVYPAALVPQLEGALRASARVKVENNRAEALLQSEIDDAHVLVAVDPATGAQAELRSPKSTAGVLANIDLANPSVVTVQTFEASSDRADVRFAEDAGGRSAAGQFGNALVKLAGRVDAGAMLAEVSGLSVDVNGMSLGLSDKGAAVAALSSGLMKIVAGAAQQPVRVPLAGAGDFALPQIDLGIDNLAFQYTAGGQNQESNLGNVRARLGADGYIGPEKRQLVNIRTASFAAAPAAVNSRAQMDLGSGAFLAEYAARVAPAGLSSILAYLGLPPALLTNAAATGTVAFNNGQITSKGAANGELRIAQGGQGEITPFETAHDLSAAWNPAEGSLALEIRRLDGNLKTAAGEAVATMAAQPSQLMLSRTGSRGLLDLRFGGSAGPTRALALGLAGVLPQLSDLAATLSATQAGGVYSAWAQVREKDPTTLGFNIGGTWRGAALSVANVPYLSEAGELSAALEGDIAYQENTLRLSRLFLSSESAQMRAEGSAAVVYAAGADHMPSGLANVTADLRFDAADIALAGRVFPGVLPPELGLSGRIGGALSAAGDAGNVQISQCVMNFQNFRATPSEGLEITVPQGAANVGASLALHFAANATGSAYDIFRMFDVRDGRAALTGAQVRGKHVDNMSSTFALQGGVLTIGDARVVIGGGADGQIAANGTVDFNQPAPAVSVRVAMRNIPLAEVNSELTDYMQFQQGVLHIPAQQGQSAGVAFSGFSEDEILRTLRLDNFNFATGPVALLTGPVLTAELDKARAILKMGDRGEARQITFASVDGSAEARGNGVITIPESRPIAITGDNTADFRAQGTVRADHTLDMRVMVAGNMQKIITLPNIIPNLSMAEGNQERNLMSRINESAARGAYGVNVTGALESPDIGGISAIALQIFQDLIASAPAQLIGNLLDAPESVVKLGQNVVEGITNPDALKHAPENLLKGVGGMFGIGGQQQQQQQQQNQEQQEGQGQDGQQQQQRSSERPERQLLQGLGRMLGGNR